MKKIIGVWLALFALALAFSGTALGAPFRFSGNLSNRAGWGGKPYQGSSLALSAVGSRIHGAAVIDGVEGLMGGASLEQSLRALQLKEAYLELDAGAWTGKDTRLRLGTLDIDYSPYLALFQPWRGLGVAALPLGPATLSTFYAWNSEAPLFGAKIGTDSLPNTELSVNWLSGGSARTFSVEGITLPFRPLALTWAVARNERGYGPVKLDGSWNLAENLTLKGGYRSFPTYDEFDPAYRDRREDDWGDPANPVDLYHGQTGFSAGAAFRVVGINTDLAYEQFDQRLGSADTGDRLPAGKNRVYQLALSKVFPFGWAALNNGYIRRYQYAPGFDLQTDIFRAGLRLNHPLLQGLELGGEFRTELEGDGERTQRSLGVVSYQHSGLSGKWIYDFSTGTSTAETLVQVRF
jgi:hypothetical protein